MMVTFSVFVTTGKTGFCAREFWATITAQRRKQQRTLHRIIQKGSIRYPRTNFSFKRSGLHPQDNSISKRLLHLTDELFQIRNVPAYSVLLYSTVNKILE